MTNIMDLVNFYNIFNFVEQFVILTIVPPKNGSFTRKGSRLLFRVNIGFKKYIFYMIYMGLAMFFSRSKSYRRI